MSGIGRYLQTLLPRLLPRLNATAITVLGDGNDLAGECWASDPRVRIREHRARIFSVAEQIAFAKGVYRGIDLLWVPQYNVPLAYSGKLLVTIHDLCQLAMPETLGSTVQRWYSRFLFSRVAAQAAAILCVSEFTASEAQKLLGISQQRLTVAYPCIEESWNRSAVDGQPLRSSPYLLVVGNVKKHKNLMTVVAAFNRIRDRIGHDLVIVGRREGFLNSDSEIGEMLRGSDDRIAFTGHIPDAMLLRYYRGADALLFPSLYEGFGYPLVEAMTLGCPIVCSNAASLPEVAGDAALFFNPASVEEIASVLLTIAEDGSLRSELSRKGSIRLERFRGDKSAQITAAVINRLLGG